MCILVYKNVIIKKTIYFHKFLYPVSDRQILIVKLDCENSIHIEGECLIQARLRKYSATLNSSINQYSSEDN